MRGRWTVAVPVELVFWGWDSGNSMKEILADFEKANPGIMGWDVTKNVDLSALRATSAI